MAIYQPPDAVVVAIGAAYPGPLLVRAGRRLVERVRAELTCLRPLGLESEAVDEVEELLDGLERMLSSARAQKHDTSLQMRTVAELLSETRGWLLTLRLIASLNLAADTPALSRLWSPEPERIEGYPRDVLSELENRLRAAHDLAPRLADAGLSRGFLIGGRKLASQLRTAIGPLDLRPEDLDLEIRRLYVRKGTLYLRLKRWTRLGKLAFVAEPRRSAGFDLRELEITKRRPLPSTTDTETTEP